MLYPKFTQRYLATVVCCLILALGVSTLFLVYSFHIGRSPLLLDATSTSNNGAASSIVVKKLKGNTNNNNRAAHFINNNEDHFHGVFRESPIEPPQINVMQSTMQPNIVSSESIKTKQPVHRDDSNMHDDRLIDGSVQKMNYDSTFSEEENFGDNDSSATWIDPANDNQKPKKTEIDVGNYADTIYIDDFERTRIGGGGQNRETQLSVEELSIENEEDNNNSNEDNSNEFQVKQLNYFQISRNGQQQQQQTPIKLRQSNRSKKRTQKHNNLISELPNGELLPTMEAMLLTTRAEKSAHRLRKPYRVDWVNWEASTTMRRNNERNKAAPAHTRYNLDTLYDSSQNSYENHYGDGSDNDDDNDDNDDDFAENGSGSGDFDIIETEKDNSVVYYDDDNERAHISHQDWIIGGIKPPASQKRKQQRRGSKKNKNDFRHFTNKHNDEVGESNEMSKIGKKKKKYKQHKSHPTHFGSSNEAIKDIVDYDELKSYNLNLSFDFVSNLTAPQLYQDVRSQVLRKDSQPTEATTTMSSTNTYETPATTIPVRGRIQLNRNKHNSRIKKNKVQLPPAPFNGGDQLLTTTAPQPSWGATESIATKLLLQPKQMMNEAAVGYSATAAVGRRPSALMDANASSVTWLETRTRRIMGNVKKSEERSRQLLLCEEAGGGELCRMLFKGHISE